MRWSIPRHTRPATHSSSWEKMVRDNKVQAIAADLGEERKDAEPDLIRQPEAPEDRLVVMVRVGRPDQPASLVPVRLADTAAHGDE